MILIDPYFEQNGIEKTHIQAKLGPLNKNSKTFRIINAHIDANLLFLNIEYRASCSGNDSFEFLGGTLYHNEQNIPCRETQLFISGTNEVCSIKNEIKIIDLHELTSKEVKYSEVLLSISGFRTKMTYVYLPEKS